MKHIFNTFKKLTFPSFIHPNKVMFLKTASFLKRNYTTKESEKNEEYYKNKWEKTYLEKNSKDTSLIVLKDSEGSELGRGNFFIRENKILRKSDINDVKKTNIIAFGGIDFDNEKFHNALLKNLENLISLSPLGNLNELSYLAYQSIYTKNERYNHLINYSLNPHYFSPEAKEFSEKYIIPRLLDLSDTMPESQRYITLFSFSAGGRDIMMIENAVRDILIKQYNFNIEEVAYFLSFIKSFSIGYAPELDNLPEPRFKKLIICAYEDGGILKPQSFNDRFMNKGKEFWDESYKFISNEQSKSYLENDDKVAETLLLLNENTLEIYFEDKFNHNGHSLPHYIKSISKILSKDDLDQLVAWLYPYFPTLIKTSTSVQKIIETDNIDNKVNEKLNWLAEILKETDSKNMIFAEEDEYIGKGF